MDIHTEEQRVMKYAPDSHFVREHLVQHSVINPGIDTPGPVKQMFLIHVQEEK